MTAKFTPDAGAAVSALLPPMLRPLLTLMVWFWSVHPLLGDSQSMCHTALCLLPVRFKSLSPSTSAALLCLQAVSFSLVAAAHPQQCKTQYRSLRALGVVWCIGIGRGIQVVSTSASIVARLLRELPV